MWDDPNDYYRGTEAEKVLEEIRLLKRKHSLSIEEGKRLTNLQTRLFEIQSKCTHYWSLILLFNRHSRFCKWCDKEDPDYVHRD